MKMEIKASVIPNAECAQSAESKEPTDDMSILEHAEFIAALSGEVLANDQTV
jgi:hypothetical protein